jgi:hypothetical protein
MKEEKAGQAARAGRFLGSLKDALVAASRDDTQPAPAPVLPPPPKPVAALPAPDTPAAAPPAADQPAAAAAIPSAEEAARQARGASTPLEQRHVEIDAPPTTRVVRSPRKESAAMPDAEDDVTAPARTQIVRGKQRVERGEFNQDPVVGWLVVVGGPGIGSYRPIFEGNNTIGRSDKNRVPVDFGDDAISSDEQAYIRYDSSDRSFLFVPNLAKTNVVSLNSKRPTAAVELHQMDVITMGRTQLVFVPFCGPEFDWAALAEANKG